MKTIKALARCNENVLVCAKEMEKDREHANLKQRRREDNNEGSEEIEFMSYNTEKAFAIRSIFS